MPRMKLTQARVARLRTTRVQTELIDSGFSAGCFGVRVFGSGKKSYFVRYQAQSGKTRRLRIGNTELLTLKEAQTNALAVLVAVANGNDPADVEATRGSHMTVAELATEYLAHHVAVKLRPTSYDNYRQILTRHLLPALGSYRLTAVTPGIINHQLVQLQETEGIWKTASIVLSSMFRYALTQKLLDYSPCHGGQLIRYPKNVRTRVLNDWEVIAYWQACGALSRIDLQVFFQLLLLSGTRSNELFHATRDTLSATALYIAPEYAKVRRASVVPLAPQAQALVALLPVRADGRLFAPLSERGRKRSAHFRVLRAAMGVTSADVIMHDLRRTVATNLERMGFSHAIIAAVLSHNKAVQYGGTTYHYTHYCYREEKQEALGCWADRVEALVAGTELPLPLHASLSAFRERQGQKEAL